MARLFRGYRAPTVSNLPAISSVMFCRLCIYEGNAMERLRSASSNPGSGSPVVNT